MPNRMWSRQNLIRNLLMGGTVLAAIVAAAFLPASTQEVFNGHKDLGMAIALWTLEGRSPAPW